MSSSFSQWGKARDGEVVGKKQNAYWWNNPTCKWRDWFVALQWEEEKEEKKIEAEESPEMPVLRESVF